MFSFVDTPNYGVWVAQTDPIPRTRLHGPEAIADKTCPICHVVGFNQELGGC